MTIIKLLGCVGFVGTSGVVGGLALEEGHKLDDVLDRYEAPEEQGKAESDDGGPDLRLDVGAGREEGALDEEGGTEGKADPGGEFAVLDFAVGAAQDGFAHGQSVSVHEVYQ